VFICVLSEIEGFVAKNQAAEGGTDYSVQAEDRTFRIIEFYFEL
jgi:hypothetical protein